MVNISKQLHFLSSHPPILIVIIDSQSFNWSLCTSACVFAGIAAIGLINEALDEGDPMKTLAMLQNPSAKLTDVDPSVAQHYHDKLLEARREKAHVRHTHRFL